MNPPISAFMLRINAFARDLGTYSLTKKMLNKRERDQVEAELRSEFEYLLRQSPETLDRMARDAEFGA